MKKLIILMIMVLAVSAYAETSKYGSMWKQEDTTLYPADDIAEVDLTDISGQVSFGSVSIGSVAFTGLTSLTATGSVPTDIHQVHCDASAGDVTLNIHSSLSSPSVGLVHNIKKIDSSVNDCIIDPAGSETVDGLTTFTLSAQYENLTIYTDLSNWFIR